MSNNSCAPVVLFCYKRLDTLIETISALKNNDLSTESELFIFSDAAKCDSDINRVDEVREYLKNITGFKAVKVHYATVNKGLARSVIDGVSQILEKFEYVIVVEDDLVTAPHFLRFMNQALLKYKDELQVNAISGYSFDFKKSSDSMAYFLNRPWPWTWATWNNRWNNIDWDIKDYSSFFSDRKNKLGFAKLGSDVVSMLRKQMNGKIDSWAIRWTFHQFRTQTLCLYPPVSLVRNIGFGKDATHTRGSFRRYNSPIALDLPTDINFPTEIIVIPTDQSLLLEKMGMKSRIKSKIETFWMRLNFFYRLILLKKK